MKYKSDELKELLQTIKQNEGLDIEKLNEGYRTRMAWSLNAYGSHPVSFADVRMLLNGNMEAYGHADRAAQEILGTAKAYDYMCSLVRKGQIDENDIKMFHTLYLEDISGVKKGEYRDCNHDGVAVCRDVPKLMDELVAWIEEMTPQTHPFDLAARVHYKLIKIMPFQEGNTVIALLTMNTILIQNHYLPIPIQPLRWYKDWYAMGNKNVLRSSLGIDQAAEIFVDEVIEEREAHELETTIITSGYPIPTAARRLFSNQNIFDLLDAVRELERDLHGATDAETRRALESRVDSMIHTLCVELGGGPACFDDGARILSTDEKSVRLSIYDPSIMADVELARLQ